MERDVSAEVRGAHVQTAHAALPHDEIAEGVDVEDRSGAPHPEQGCAAAGVEQLDDLAVASMPIISKGVVDAAAAGERLDLLDAGAVGGVDGVVRAEGAGELERD